MSRLLPLLVLASLIPSVARAGNWPTYLNDNARVGATNESIPDDLQLKWVYTSPAKPELSFSGPRAELIEHALVADAFQIDERIVAVHQSQLGADAEQFDLALKFIGQELVVGV